MNPEDLEEQIIEEVFADAADKGESETDTIFLLADIFEGLDETVA